MNKITESAVENGKLLYFDPNNVTVKGPGENLTVIFNGLEVMKDPEDYSIAVDLEVVNKSRTNITTNDGKSFGLTALGEAANFLQGKNLGDTNVLSTFFTDITYSGDEPTNVNEAMCINSIDIELTSWYVASVVVKFTDIRGASLYSPTEYAVNNAGNGKTSDGSIFSGFFTMPYPIFKLKVKGFYGNTVTYPLHLTEYKSEFNSEKGNVDITCHFIGYTYAMLNDIQMTYLIAAPSCPEGDAYWSGQISNGRFKTLEGKDLPKIPQLLQKIKDGENAKSDMDGNDSTVKMVKELNEQEKILTKIKTTIDSYVAALKKGYTVSFTGKQYDLTITTNNNSKCKLTPQMGGDKYVGGYIVNLGAMVAAFNNKYKESTMFSMYEDPIEFFALKTAPEGANKATIDLSDIINRIDVFLKESGSNRKKLGDQVADSINNRLVEIYGMVPSIYNFTKLLLAHMETLLHIIGDCANKVTSEELDKEYAAGNEGTDIIGNQLSPFPWLTINDKDEWLGNYYPDRPEVKLVNSLLNAKHNITAELQKIETLTPSINIAETGTTVTIGDIWIPINAFDNSISKIGGKTKKPYSNVSNNGFYNDELKALFSTRIATIAGLSSDLIYNQNNYNSFILGESKNIAEYLGQNKETINKTISILGGITETIETKDLVKRGKYKLLTNYKAGSGSFYEYNLLNTKGLLPLNDDSVETHQKHIIGGEIIDGDLKFYRPANVSGNTDYSVRKPTNTVIIDGSADCNKIYNDWFLKVKGLYSPENGGDIDEMLRRYALSRGDAAASFIDVTYDPQPLLNKIAYFKKELGIDNEIQIGELNIKCGLTKAPFSSNDETFLNFFKGYLGENQWETVKDKSIDKLSPKSFFENEKIDTTTLTYPMIGGLYTKKYSKEEKNKKEKNVRSISCLFGSELYYHQNSRITAQSGSYSYDNISLEANKAKAFLFLQTLPIKILSFDKLLTETSGLDRSFMVRIPKGEALLIGSMLWRYYADGKINAPKDYILPSETDYTYKNNYFRTPKDLFSLVKVGAFGISTLSQYPAVVLSKIAEHEDMKNKFLDFFSDWVNSTRADGWVTIRDAFEFKGVNNELFDAQRFLNFSQKLYDNKIYNLNEEIYSGHTNNYYHIGSLTTDTVGLINKDGGDGVKAVISLLFNECIVAYSGDGILCQTKRGVAGTTLTDLKISTIRNGLAAKLRDQSKKITTEGVVMPDGSTASLDSLSVIDDENINMQMYRYLKNLYDRWVCGFEFNSDNSEYKWIDIHKSVVNGYKDTYDLVNFKFIDRSYNNIGDKFIINFNDVVQNMIGLEQQKTLYTTITDIFSANQFLFIPLPNYQSWKTPDEFAKIFQPIPYIKADMDGDVATSIFICMYTGIPSKRLNISDKSYMYQDDGLNLNLHESNNVPEDFQTVAEKDIDNTDTKMDKVPAFAVSYGRQNQSYFKNIVLNQNDPVTTEASINVLKQLNDRTDKKSAVTTTTQDMYNLYSDYAYTCNVEMLGCAQIQPMMYFQLTNVPMWNGAYLIYKVSHSIRPGAMTTNFTGMRMSKNYPKLVTPGIITSDRLNNSLTVTPENKIKSTVSWDKLIGKYFTLSQYCTTDKGAGKTHVNEVYEYIVSRLEYNLAPTIDSIYDSWIVSAEGKQYGKFKITNGYRNNTPKSQHYQGLAADIQLERPTSAGNEALFRHIVRRMDAGLKMDELINETNSTSTGWCHVSPVCFKNNVVEVRGQYSYGKLQKDNLTTVITDAKYSENAKASGKIKNIGGELERFIRYIKGAENGMAVGWNEGNDGLWRPYGDAKVTIGYGIVFKLNGQLNVKTPQMKQAVSAHFNDTANIRVKDEDMERELRKQIDDGLLNIQKDLNSLYGNGTYDKIQDKYKYAIYDLYHNFGPTGYKSSDNVKNTEFIKAAINNNLTGMINNADRIVNGASQPGRTSKFKEYLNS